MKPKFLLILTLVVAVSLSIWQASAPATANDNLIRFHVIANSDKSYDQEVKLKVRDAILNQYADALEGTNYKEANAFLYAHKDEIASIANETLNANGFTYSAKVIIGKDTFPTKQYGDVVLEAGEYHSVKVILGDGEGKNWWCVLFPPLCFVDVTKNTGIAKLEITDTNEESQIVPADADITEVKMKSKILELLSE